MAAPQGVNFDGSTYLNRGADLTGNADSKLLTGSFWYKSDGISSDEIIFSNSKIDIYHRTFDKKIYFYATNSGVVLNCSSTATINDTNWHHICFSFDMANTSNRHLYIDDVSGLSVSTYSNQNFDFTVSDHFVGRHYSGSILYLSGDLADLYINMGEYVDLSVTANRRKFVGALAASSADLGSDGSTPTGTSPIVFLSGATATWHTNDGTGGGFTENGTLTDAGTNPPDYLVPGATTMDAGMGSFTITGYAADLRNFKLVAGQGSYTVTGLDAGLSVGTTAVAETGYYAVTGQDASLLHDRVMVAEQGSYAITGLDAALNKGYGLSLDHGSFVITGYDAVGRWDRILGAGHGDYEITGYDAGLNYGRFITAGQGSYTITGYDVTTIRGYAVIADFGAYTVTGFDATFTAPDWQFLPINPTETWAAGTDTHDTWNDTPAGGTETWQ